MTQAFKAYAVTMQVHVGRTEEMVLSLELLSLSQMCFVVLYAQSFSLYVMMF